MYYMQNNYNIRDSLIKVLFQMLNQNTGEKKEVSPKMSEFLQKMFKKRSV